LNLLLEHGLDYEMQVFRLQGAAANPNTSTDAFTLDNLNDEMWKEFPEFSSAPQTPIPFLDLDGQPFSLGSQNSSQNLAALNANRNPSSPNLSLHNHRNSHLSLDSIPFIQIPHNSNPPPQTITQLSHFQQHQQQQMQQQQTRQIPQNANEKQNLSQKIQLTPQALPQVLTIPSAAQSPLPVSQVSTPQSPYSTIASPPFLQLQQQHQHQQKQQKQQQQQQHHQQQQQQQQQQQKKKVQSPPSLSTLQITAANKAALAAPSAQRASNEPQVQAQAQTDGAANSLLKFYQSNSSQNLAQNDVPTPQVGEKRKLDPKQQNGVYDTIEKKRKVFEIGDSGDEDSNGEEAGNRNEEERRRHAHVSAEQKRRDSIKQAFANLKDLIPQYKDKPNVSKAFILKGAIEWITNLLECKNENTKLRQENEALRKALNKKKSMTGAPEKEEEMPAMKRIPSQPYND